MIRNHYQNLSGKAIFLKIWKTRHGTPQHHWSPAPEAAQSAGAFAAEACGASPAEGVGCFARDDCADRGAGALDRRLRASLPFGSFCGSAGLVFVATWQCRACEPARQRTSVGDNGSWLMGTRIPFDFPKPRSALALVFLSTKQSATGMSHLRSHFGIMPIPRGAGCLNLEGRPPSDFLIGRKTNGR